MHHKNFLLSILLFTYAGIICAQKITVLGIVKNNNVVAVPFANVVFETISTPKTVVGVMSKEDGGFSIFLEPKRYNLTISRAGVIAYTKAIDLRGAASKMNLGTFHIKTEIALDEVVVKSSNTPRIALDKKVYDVTKDILGSGGSLLDLMQNIPSVQVEVDGAVSIRGDGNVQILIDGRLSGLTSTAAFLRTIPAASIAKIEVITNPSSKYNAQGTGGIINIVLKKGRKKDLNGSAEVFSGIRINSGLNLNLNQGGERLKWYYNGGIGYSEPKAVREIFLNNVDPVALDTDQFSELILRQFYVLNNLGGQWIINPKHSFSADLTYRMASLNTSNTIQYTDFNEDEIRNIITRDDYQIERNNFLQFRSDYELMLNDKGSKLELGWVAQKGTETNFSNITDQLLFPKNEVVHMDSIQNNLKDRRHTFSADLLWSLSKKAQWEMGVRNRTTRIDNDFMVERSVDTMSTTIPEFTDATTYDERVFALYGQFAKRLDKVKFQLGLRMETTGIDIQTQETQEAIRYTDVFPSGFLEYGWNEDNTLRVSVSRRIQRPGRNALVPFSSFSDSRNILIGNPDVNPTYVVLSELGYSGKLGSRLTLTPTFFYRNSKDVQDFFIENQRIAIDGALQDIFVTTTVNIGENYTYGLELSTSYDLFPWWNLYSEFTVDGFKQIGQFRGRDFNSSGIRARGRLHFNFNISESLKFQIQHRYRNGYERGQFRNKPIYRMEAAMSKKMFKDRGILTLNFKDIFNTWKFRIATNGNDFDQLLNIQIRTPQLNIAFSYVFNEKKDKGKKGQQYNKL